MPDARDIYTAEDFAAYDVDAERGFLPAEDPLTRIDTTDLTEEHAAYIEDVEQLAGDIPRLIDRDTLHAALTFLDEPAEGLYDALDERELFRLYQATAFLASAYIHQTNTPADRDALPEGVAQPLYETTTRLDVPPILSYDAYSLANWERRDETGPLEVDNLDTPLNFVDLDTPGRNDESWFMLIHVEIEQEAAPALQAIPYAQRAADDGDAETMRVALENINESLDAMAGTMERMPDHNSPDVYGEGFRPYIESFEDVEYDGVDAVEGPQTIRGETGAQSSIYPALDAAFGVPHQKNELVEHIDDMRAFMPPGHRDFIAAVEEAPGITDYVAEAEDENLVELHDAALRKMAAFRFLHWQYAKTYIEEPTGDTEGTGGTEYVAFLPQLIEETEEQMIGDPYPEQWMYLADVFEDPPDGIMD